MQITNATQMLPSADLMNSADGSSMRFPLLVLHQSNIFSSNAKTLKLGETWCKPQSKSATPEKNFKLSAPIHCFPVFSSLGLTTFWCTESTPVKLLGNMTGDHITAVPPV